MWILEDKNQIQKSMYISWYLSSGFYGRGPLPSKTYLYLCKWGLPVVSHIQSPSGQDQWTIQEVMKMGIPDSRQKANLFPFPKLWNMPGSNFAAPIQPLTCIQLMIISYGSLAIKSKNSFYADAEEKDEEKEAAKEMAKLSKALQLSAI